MPFVYSLCSSSKGNATYAGDKKSGILIDAGLSLRQLDRQLSLRDIHISAVKAIFITHEHSDHIKGLAAIAAALRVPLYGSRKTIEYLIEKNIIPAGATVYEIRKKTPQVAGITVSAFTIPHDSVHPLGYKLQFESGKSACICTDLGYITDEVYENLYGSDFVLLESNYDDNLLANGPYPHFLKKRIRSHSGHLSNEECAKTILSLFNMGTTKFTLGHLSEQNNRPEIAFAETLSVLSKTGAIINEDYILTVAKQQSLGEAVTL